MGDAAMQRTAVFEGERSEALAQMTACRSCGGWSVGYQFTEDCGGMDVTGLRTG